MRLESTCKPRKKHYVWDWNLPANRVKAWDFCLTFCFAVIVPVINIEFTGSAPLDRSASDHSDECIRYSEIGSKQGRPKRKIGFCFRIFGVFLFSKPPHPTTTTDCKWKRNVWRHNLKDKCWECGKNTMQPFKLFTSRREIGQNFAIHF